MKGCQLSKRDTAQACLSNRPSKVKKCIIATLGQGRMILKEWPLYVLMHIDAPSKCRESRRGLTYFPAHSLPAKSTAGGLFLYLVLRMEYFSCRRL